MADIAGLVVNIATIIDSLYHYGKKVRSAKDDIRNLTQELFVLKGILEHIQKQREDAAQEPEDQDLLTSRDFADMLTSTNRFLQELHASLKVPTGGFKRRLEVLYWPLKHEEAFEHLQRLERAKSWFIMAMVSDNGNVMQKVHDQVMLLTTTLEKERMERESHRLISDRKRFFHWLSPVDPSSMHVKALEVGEIGSGEWFLSGALAEWLRPESDSGRLLWVRGKSGAGKTTLMAKSVERGSASVKHVGNSVLAYFYCLSTERKSQEPINVLGSLVAQACHTLPTIVEALIPLYETYQQEPKPKELLMRDLEAIFLKTIPPSAPLYVIVDGINESEQQDEVLALLVRLLSRLPRLRILLTSTGSPPKSVDMDSVPLRELKMDPAMVKGDIKHYVSHRLESDYTLRRQNHSLKEAIKKTVVAQADGMFRYAKLQLDYLSEQRTGRAIRGALSEMPQDLNQTYQAMLKRVRRSDWELARRALLWVCFCERILTLQELNEAVVIEEGDQAMDPESRLQEPQDLLDICKGLLDFNISTQLVSLSHDSIRVFLITEPILHSEVSFFAIRPNQANKAIARVCLTYLNFRDLSSGFCYLPTEFEVRERGLPLLDYAAYNWALHATSLDESDWPLIRTFFETRKLPCRGNYGAWIQCLIGAVEAMDIPLVFQTHPLYYAASFGLDLVVSKLFQSEKNIEVDAPGGRFSSTALQVACFKENKSTAELLVRAGADPHVCDSSTGLTARDLAHINEWDDLVEVMDRMMDGAKNERGGEARIGVQDGF